MNTLPSCLALMVAGTPAAALWPWAFLNYHYYGRLA